MPTRDLADACRYLREAIPQLIDLYNGRYENEGRMARVGEVLRSTKEQQDKYAQGRTVPGIIVTQADGLTSVSAHQAQTLHGDVASHAVDIDIVSPDGKHYYAIDKYYLPLIGLATAFRILSGGDWQKPDLPHLSCAYRRG